MAKENLLQERRDYWLTNKFESIISESSKKRRCLAPGCNQEYVWTVSHEHMRDHWRKKHDDVSIMERGRIKLHPQEWNHNLMLFIVKANREYSLVDHEIFRQFCKSMDSSKRILNRKQLSEGIKQNCDDFTKCIIHLLKESSSISLTFDIWSARNSQRSFIAITAHFVDSQMGLKGFTLEFRRFHYPHNTERVTKYLKDVIQLYQIETKVISITADNASVNTSAIRALKSDLDLGSRFGFKDLQVRCLAHIINLAVKESVDRLKDIVQPIKKIVGIIHKSTKRSENFDLIQKEINEKSTGFGSTKVYHLIDDIETRWNSTYFMLERFFKLKEAVDEAIIQMQGLDDGIQIDWISIRKLLNYLKPFQDLTKRVSGQKYCSLSYVSSSVAILMRHTSSFFTDEMLKDSAQALHSKLMDYSTVMRNDLAVVASVLDPRIKLSFLKDECHDQVKEKLRYYMNRIDPSELDISNDSSQSTRQDEASLLDEIFLNDTTDEVSHYCSLSRELKNVDVLDYWRTNLTAFPKLAKLAKCILCVQATSVPSEQVFSKAGLIDTPRRCNLSDEKFRSNILLNSWFDILN